MGPYGDTISYRCGAEAVLDYKFQGLLSMHFKGDADAETAFQGWFFGTLNMSVLVLQFIVTPLALNFVGLRWVHILMPMIHFAAITAALIEPNVMTVGLAFFLFKAFDYSICLICPTYMNKCAPSGPVHLDDGHLRAVM
ncbi:hypothetical protein N8290_01935 [Pseudomonadales bacterium]|nr:hypothetical protein [Pseudomonadales bacterium]MDC1368296.1 hypothetical protein [Pseudomonadales bacterium]